MEGASTPALLDRARSGDPDAFSALVRPHRRELCDHAYRMIGSVSEADDAVQEALVRAWKGLATFEARASLRTWLYRITTHVCLSALERRPHRTLPYVERPAARPEDPFSPPVLDPIWLDPYPGEAVGTPEARVSARESVGLAFLAALHRLPPRQRAVLLLFDVVGLSVAEVADELGDSAASVQSALQRARETMETSGGYRSAPRPPDEVQRSLLEGYLRAWESADVGALVALLAQDARLSMPPMPEWFSGAEDIGRSIGAMVFTPEAKGAMRGVVTTVNGLPGVAMYRRGEDGRLHPASLHALRMEGDRIVEIVAFLGGAHFERFGLAPFLDA